MEAFHPDQVEYFEEERELDTVVREGVPVDGATTCRHRLRWSWLFGAILDCQDETEEVVTRRLGIETEQRQDLEAGIRVALGAEFIGKLESEVKGAFGESLTITWEHTEAKSFKFRGRDCFRTSVNLYQLQSRLDLSCEWKPRFSKKKYWSKSVHVNHNRFAQIKNAQRAHQTCGCEDPEADHIDQFSINSSSLELLEPFVIRNRSLVPFTVGIVVQEGRVSTFDTEEKFPLWPPRDLVRDWTVDEAQAYAEQTEPLLHSVVPLPSMILPAYLRFLTGLGSEGSIAVRFRIPEQAEFA